MKHWLTIGVLALGFCVTILDRADPLAVQVGAARHGGMVEEVFAGKFRWKVGQPLLGINPRGLPRSPDNPWVAVKDPSIVRYEGRWHLFCSLRKQKGGQGRIRIGSLSFADWKEAPTAQWHLLKLSEDYHGAPQVFYFTPHQKWYLVYQAADRSRDIAYGPCYSTTDDLTDAGSWSLPSPFYALKPDHVPGWLDFWVICDETKAHLFFTSLNGQMWRADTALEDFPVGWTRPEVVLEGDVFEASHTYLLGGLGKYLTVIEAQAGSRRYQKAYLADRLDGEWTPLAATLQNPFASPVNVRTKGPHWTDSFSHGELIRTGYDQTLQVDPDNLRFLFQGVSDQDRRGKKYGAIPWRLGLLEPVD